MQNSSESLLVFGVFICLLFVGILILLWLFYNRRRLSTIVFKEKEKLKEEQLKLQFQKELVKEVLLAEEATKQQISTELHDDVGATLSALKHMVFLKSKKLNIEEEFAVVNDTLNELMAKIRDLSQLLTPQNIKGSTLSQLIGIIVKRAQQSTESDIVHEVIERESKLDYNDKLSIVRFIQEALNNAVKYSQANQITVNLYIEGRKIRLIVKDNGIGFNKQLIRSKPGGYGLANLEARAQSIGGSLVINTFEGKGVTIELNREV